MAYESDWTVLYEEEKSRVQEATAHKVKTVERIGITAVHGLGAKPIINMMAGVSDPNDAEECLTLLRSLGYDDVTPQQGNPDWFYCLGKNTRSPGKATRFHLHLVRYMSEHWVKHILFYDCLRAHPMVGNEYYELKRRLAAEYGSDREAYTEAKTKFIESVVLQDRRQGAPLA